MGKLCFYIRAIVLKNQNFNVFVDNKDQMGYGLHCSPVKELDELHKSRSFLITCFFLHKLFKKFLTPFTRANEKYKVMKVKIAKL